MKKSVITGAILATAIGTMFAASPLLVTTARAAEGQVKCMGGNACAGKSACKTAQSPGPGKNSCAGKGFVMTKTAEECTAKKGHPAS